MEEEVDRGGGRGCCSVSRRRRGRKSEVGERRKAKKVEEDE